MSGLGTGGCAASCGMCAELESHYLETLLSDKDEL